MLYGILSAYQTMGDKRKKVSSRGGAAAESFSAALHSGANRKNPQITHRGETYYERSIGRRMAAMVAAARRGWHRVYRICRHRLFCRICGAYGKAWPQPLLGILNANCPALGQA